MGGKLLVVMTGAALLASVAVANAGQRATLTDAQLDRVVAGVDAQVTAFASNALGTGSYMLLANDATGVGFATITNTFTTAGPAPHFVSESAAVFP